MRYLSDMYKSEKDEKSISFAVDTFKVAAKYEEEWGADICTRSAEELDGLVNEIAGLRTKAKWTRINVLKKYVKWCINNNVPGACDGMLNINSVGYGKLKLYMIKNPLQMDKFLTDVFGDDTDPTIDDVYKGYLWLAYHGVNHDFITELKTSDIDLFNRTIKYKGRYLEIYPKAFPVLKNLLSDTMIYRKNDYAESKRERNRAPGDKLLRGFRTSTVNVRGIRDEVSRKVARANKSGNTDKVISYQRAWMSGIFYRAYEAEELGDTVEFISIANEYIEDKNFDDSVPHEVRLASISREFKRDYEKWKGAFNL